MLFTILLPKDDIDGAELGIHVVSLHQLKPISSLNKTIVPKKRVFLRGKWNHLLFANYEVDPAVLQSHIPAGTTLDSWNEIVFLSLVAFRFSDTSVLGIPTLGWRNFDEVNLRFYVKCEVDQEIRNGVVFIKEIVPSWLVSKIANLLYGENYQNKEMLSSVELLPSSNKNINYEVKDSNASNNFSAFVENTGKIPPRDSLESYITEHYWGYAKKDSKTTMEYEVEHPQWKVTKVDDYGINFDFEQVYGNQYSFLSSLKPQSVFYCEGSEISVRMGKKLKP